jgi:predicted DNA-binding transcriptional regulator YafY
VKSGRLLSLVLLLQAKGRMTAAQLAAELEVSPRTIYRDIEALLGAGVPLYADAGHGGGYSLIGGYRTRLTGFSAREAQAIFLSGVPGPAAELGLGPVLAAAQLKLRAALPPELVPGAELIRSRFHLDAPGWYAQHDDARFLPKVAEAVWHSTVLCVRYRRWKEPTEVSRRLEPYGLVLKAGRWYLVAGPGPRAYRIDQILELSMTGETFQPPRQFDLASFWQRYQAEFHASLRRGTAVVRLAPGALSRLAPAAAQAAAITGTSEPSGWTRAVLPIESLDHAHSAFLALGTDVEVLEPAELRARLAHTARELAARYAPA